MGCMAKSYRESGVVNGVVGLEDYLLLLFRREVDK